MRQGLDYVSLEDLPDGSVIGTSPVRVGKFRFHHQWFINYSKCRPTATDCSAVQLPNWEPLMQDPYRLPLVWRRSKLHGERTQYMRKH